MNRALLLAAYAMILAGTLGQPLPAACERMRCKAPSACGYREDRSVGCLPLKIPDRKEPEPPGPDDCARVICVEGQKCGRRKDKSIGCVPDEKNPRPNPAKGIPAECADIPCKAPSKCGFRDDGSVGCLPLTIPDRKEPEPPLPKECAEKYCPEGQKCGRRDNKSVGCFPSEKGPDRQAANTASATQPVPSQDTASIGAPSAAPQGSDKCLCIQIYTPTPCCRPDGVHFYASNACSCLAPSDFITET